ncbi:MAG TPA: hypothetical protein VM430_08170 [Microbacterium sp.]|nr:hypothetical protein [Microbacterium sp.]
MIEPYIIIPFAWAAFVAGFIARDAVERHRRAKRIERACLDGLRGDTWRSFDGELWERIS